MDSLHTTGQGSRGHIKVKVCPRCGSDMLIYLSKSWRGYFRCRNCDKVGRRYKLKEKDVYIAIG